MGCTVELTLSLASLGMTESQHIRTMDQGRMAQVRRQLGEQEQEQE